MIFDVILRIDSYSYTSESTTLTYDVKTVFETSFNVILDLLGRTALILSTLTSENKKCSHFKHKTLFIS